VNTATFATSVTDYAATVAAEESARWTALIDGLEAEANDTYIPVTYSVTDADITLWTL
jgi:hypothetical protein